MALGSYSKVANGNIAPSRFVALDTTVDGAVIQAGAGGQIYGVSGQGTRYPPYSSLDDGNTAIAGENVRVYGHLDQCMLELGATVTRGQRLKSDANGKGIATAADGDEYGAIAQQSGNAADLILVLVELGQRGA